MTNIFTNYERHMNFTDSQIDPSERIVQTDD